MATFTPIGSKTKAEIARKGHPRISRTFDTKAEAKIWAIHKEAEILGTSVPVDTRHTLKEALERYRDHVSPLNKGAQWEAVRINKFLGVRTRRYLPRPLPFVHKRIDEIVPEDIGRWRDHCMKPKKAGGLGLAPASVLREMGLLSSVFKLARSEWHWCRSNPISDTSRKGMRIKKAKVAVTDEQRDAVVEKLGYQEGVPPRTKKQETAYAFLIALETGMRNGEIMSLEPENLFLQRSYLHLDQTKNGDGRDVALSRRAVHLLSMMLQAWERRREDGDESPRIFQLVSASRDALFRKAKKDAGVTGITFHRSRHTATRRMAQKLPVLDLAKQLGMRDLKTLMIYYESDASSVAALLD